MKKFKIRIHYSTYIYDEVEADNMYDAIEIADNNIDAMDIEERKNMLEENLSYSETEIINENGDSKFII